MANATKTDTKLSSISNGMGRDSESHESLFGYNLGKHSKSTQFTICVGGTLIFYLTYGYLQEKIFSLDGFEYGWYMTLIQFIVYTICAEGDRIIVKGDPVRRAPLKNYAIIAIFMVATMGLSNTSLNYLNYPTQVLFKSCKLIPVMIGGIILLKKRYSIYEYISALLLTAGLVEITLGNAYADPISFNPLGVILICSALMADAFLGNIQESTLQSYKVHSREMVYYSHLIGTGYLLAVCIGVGQFIPAFQYCLEHPEAYFYITLFSLFGYIGVSFVLAMIKLFGAFIAVTVTSCRKFLTLGLSFVFFPKAWTIHYLIASFLVLCGISFHIYAKNQDAVDQFLFRYFGIRRPQSSESLPVSIGDVASPDRFSHKSTLSASLA